MLDSVRNTLDAIMGMENTVIKHSEKYSWKRNRLRRLTQNMNGVAE